MSVVRRSLACSIGGHSVSSGIPVFEGAINCHELINQERYNVYVDPWNMYVT